jgi:hypothetical protein
VALSLLLHVTISIGFQMKNRPEFNSMTIDELWSLHKRVSSELARKIVVQKTCLDQRLRQLSVEVDTKNKRCAAAVPARFA